MPPLPLDARSKADELRPENPIFLSKADSFRVFSPIFFPKADSFGPFSPIFLSKADSLGPFSRIFSSKDDGFGLVYRIILFKDVVLRLENPVCLAQVKVFGRKSADSILEGNVIRPHNRGSFPRFMPQFEASRLRELWQVMITPQILKILF